MRLQMNFFDYITALVRDGGKSFLMLAAVYCLARLAIESGLEKGAALSHAVIAAILLLWIVVPNGWTELSYQLGAVPSFEDLRAGRSPEVVAQVLTFEFWGSVLGIVAGFLVWIGLIEPRRWGY
ncbi:hypothetical protein [uncultured Aquitalea sp.]|uniref:hypothetical protein n=2 Tax=uncultured Aquitalea sp. TaxID=540272 RepID=UPI0025DF5A31|nr:hypothetical protein [uncultured Aquitalea sp.]